MLFILLAEPIRPTLAQEDEGVPLPVAALGEHPRLLITQAYIDETLKPRVESSASSWLAFATYLESGQPEEDAEWTPGTVLRSFALAWLVTENAQYADRARAVMVNLVNRVESGMTDDLSGEFMEDVAALAIGYDWLYGALSPADRTELEDILWRAAKQLRNPASDTNGLIWVAGQLMAFGNYEPRWLWALTAVGLALVGANEDAPALLDYCREVFIGTIIPALDVQSGGAWAEGPVYGFIANWPKVQTALAWWTAAGENHFAETLWWYDRLAYDIFLYYPTAARTYNEDWGDPIHNYPAIIGDSERYHTAVAYGRAQDLLLRTVFQGTEHGAWMDWFLRQPPEGMPGWMTVEEFLWRDPTAVGTPPPDLTWYAPFTGHVFMRSGWINEGGQLDASATYVSLNAGDRLAYHQFYDQGSFTIYHNGNDLVVRSGVYSGDGTSDHDVNYYARSIAANTILVCDLAESFDGIRPNGEREIWLNDCGQRSMSPASRTAINMDYLVENWQAYDTGSIVRFGEAGEATYIRADITGAYNSTVHTTPGNQAKVNLVQREFVYWRPGLVIVHDRVVTTYPSYTPMTIFHFQTEPTPSGLFYGSLVNDSALYMQNMLPNSRVTVVSGYQVAGQTIDRSWGEPVSNNFENLPYGFYRLEITPGGPQLDNWFLTAFIAQNASDPPPAPGLLVLGDGMRGVIMGADQVMFDLVPGDGVDVTEAGFNIGVGVTSVLLTGLQPNTTYRIEAEGRLSQELTADDAGLILLVDALPGAVRLSLPE